MKSKVFLYLTEFFAGMAVMAVELSASRLLAPYFSSSQIVWTIIIGTIMIAMALGNVFGGRWADRDNDPSKLYFRLMVAAVWIAAIPVIGKLVILGVSAAVIFTVNTNYLIWAAFVSCMVVFVFPLFLLGTVTPSLVKYTVESLDEGGSVVGRLGACNTIGSILGTFLPTFVSIPAAGTAITFLIFSGILLVLALIYFIKNRKRLVASAIATVLFIAFCAAANGSSFAFWEKDLTYEGESVYNYLQVRENEDQVFLSTNVLFGVQSVYNKRPGLTGMYYDYAMAAPSYAGCGEKPFDALILGNGTGTFAVQCRRYFGEKTVNVDAVEIDPAITDLARQYFGPPEEVPVATYDGRAYLNVNKEKYDVIMVDAYQDITIPFSMSSREFFSMVRDHLKPNGVMVVNLNMRAEDPDDPGISAWLCDTIAGCFGRIYTVDVPYSTNREVFAAKDEELFEKNMAAFGLSAQSGTAEKKALGEAAQAGTAGKKVLEESAQSVTAEKKASEESEQPVTAGKKASGETAQPVTAEKKASEVSAQSGAAGENASGASAQNRAELEVLTEKVTAALKPYQAGGRLLTDDRAPVELLGMKTIDGLIREEVLYYKDIYTEQGIEGLLEVL